jgi:uncharacterized protein (DUF2126 family)
MRRPLFALALLLVAPLVSAQVYKWVDAKGTTHFSESPPPAGTKYAQVNVAASDAEAAAASSTALPANAPTDTSDQNQVMTDTPENRAKLCTQLKGSINTLSGSGPVVEQQDGQQILLNADQRKQQLQASQSQFQQYCAQ